jgi:hypothetical protein
LATIALEDGLVGALVHKLAAEVEDAEPDFGVGEPAIRFRLPAVVDAHKSVGDDPANVPVVVPVATSPDSGIDRNLLDPAAGV